MSVLDATAKSLLECVSASVAAKCCTRSLL